MNVEHKLVKKGPKGVEQRVLWVHDDAVHTVSIRVDLPTTSARKRHRSDEAAQAALSAEVARLLRAGWAWRDGKPPGGAPPAPSATPPSRARMVTAPKWLGHPGLARERARLATRLRNAGLAHRGAELEALALPAIALRSSRATSVPSGVSRLGGAAEVEAPPGLHFVAQVSLPQVHRFDLERLLPASGLLSFFAQLDERRPGYGERAQVVLTPGSKRGPRVGGRLALLTPSLVLSLPSSESRAVGALRLTADERERYHDGVFLDWGPAHQLLGHPTAATQHSLAGRRLLAQFASDDRAGFSEGDDQALRFSFAGSGSSLRRLVCTLDEA